MTAGEVEGKGNKESAVERRMYGQIRARPLHSFPSLSVPLFQPSIYLQRLLQFPNCCFHICWEHSVLPVVSFESRAELLPTSEHVMNGTRPHQSNQSKSCQALSSSATINAPILSWAEVSAFVYPTSFTRGTHRNTGSESSNHRVPEWTHMDTWWQTLGW